MTTREETAARARRRRAARAPASGRPTTSTSGTRRATSAAPRRASSCTTDVPEKPVEPPKGIDWPMYGYDQQRRGSHRLSLARRSGASGVPRAEPARVPTGGRLTGASTSRTTAGSLFAIGAKNGGAPGGTSPHRCTASGPALSGRLVFQVFLNKTPCNSEKPGLTGQLVAFYNGSGKVRWARPSARARRPRSCEAGRVYVGDWNGDVYALSGNTGRIDWKYHTGGKVKGGLAFANGNVYAGLRPSRLLPARAGREARLAASAQQRLGIGRELLLDAGRRLRPRLHRRHRREGLLVRRDDRKPALVARHGRLRLLLAGRLEAARLRRLVQRQVLRFDAATGDVRWQFDAHAQISGSHRRSWTGSSTSPRSTRARMR